DVDVRREGIDVGKRRTVHARGRLTIMQHLPNVIVAMAYGFKPPSCHSTDRTLVLHNLPIFTSAKEASVFCSLRRSRKVALLVGGDASAQTLTYSCFLLKNPLSQLSGSTFPVSLIKSAPTSPNS